MSAAATVDSTRDRGLQDYRKKLLEHKEVESRLKESKLTLWLECKVKFFCQIIAGMINKLNRFHFHCRNKNFINYFSARTTERTY